MIMNTRLLKVLSVSSILFYSLNTTAQIKIVEINASVFSKKTKAVTLALESNRLYSVVFKKDNYPNKLVIVNTKIPSGLRELVEEPFELQIELAKNAADLKKDLTDYPVAILNVSKKEKSLMASENYYKLTHN